MKVTTFTICEQGTRNHNDDTFAHANFMAGYCVAVADGAGGHRGGAVAARLAIDAVLSHLATVTAWSDEALLAALDAASSAVHLRQSEDPALHEMSSTIVVLSLDANSRTARWTHLGDSRLLHFRRGTGEQLTRDHSVLQSLIDAHLATPEGGARLDRSVLYAALGSENETRPVVGSKAAIEDNDAFLICTDGVWDTVPLPEFVRLLEFAGSVQEWVESIAAAVRQAGKSNQDNYTALGVWIGALEENSAVKVERTGL